LDKQAIFAKPPLKLVFQGGITRDIFLPGYKKNRLKRGFFMSRFRVCRILSLYSFMAARPGGET
jgi:hypothetical protein